MGIFGVVLGILAGLCAVFATLLFGTTGGIIAGVLGVCAVVLGILKRKKDSKGGIAAIAIGALAIMMAFSLTSTWTNAFKELHNKALEYKPDGMWAQISDDTSGGLMGIIKKLPEDEASMNALVEEMDELNKLIEKK